MPCVTSVALAIQSEEELNLGQLRAALQKALGELPVESLAILELNLNIRWKPADEKK